MIDKNSIDPNALQYYRMLKEAGFSAYFVGGSVRDLLLGKIPKDFDIATNATPHQIKRIIPYGRIIGRRFRHVMLERDGGRYEIVTFRGLIVPSQNDFPEQELEDDSQNLDDRNPENSSEVEAATEENGGRKHYPDLNQFGNAQQDAIRRDFTINALFYDPDADELVDYVEGKLDIDRKVVRTIGEAAARMEEDPIRILRAIRHKIKLGLTYDSTLEAAMKEKAPLLEETSKDRIREEFLKVSIDRSMGAFLTEARRLGILAHVAPWLSSLNDEAWEKISILWQKFAETPPQDGARVSPDMGLSFMMLPLIEPLVLEPYKLTIKEGDRNYLPDMKYFLSCEPLRDYLLRNLRISRAQTDHIVRTLFYWSRMTGLWLENGPPRRVIGRLFQHPPALLAARMVKIVFPSEGKEIPEWLASLADFVPQQRGGRFRNDRGDRPNHRRDGRRDFRRDENENQGADDSEMNDLDESSSQENDDSADAGRYESREQRVDRNAPLPPPDKPMTWGGPLHAPVPRANFKEEPVIRWARKNQTVRAFRPSGVPNQPTDYAMLKSHLVGNYKPEITEPRSGDDEQNDRSSGRDRSQRAGRGGRNRNDRSRGRGGRDRNFSPVPASESANSQATNFDEDSFGNTLRPGETSQFAAAPIIAPEEIAQQNTAEFEDEDDNIGNRLDAPPTSGHVGVNGEGVLGANNQQRPPHRNNPRGGGGRGGHRGGRNNRGGRGGGRHGGGGPRGNFPPRNNQSNNS